MSGRPRRSTYTKRPDARFVSPSPVRRDVFPKLAPDVEDHAEGIADLYPRFGRTMEWDTCAPQAVLEAAGGTVRTFDGDLLRYGKPNWENPHFVCTGRLAPGGI